MCKCHRKTYEKLFIHYFSIKILLLHLTTNLPIIFARIGSSPKATSFSTVHPRLILDLLRYFLSIGFCYNIGNKRNVFEMRLNKKPMIPLRSLQNISVLQ